MSNLEIERKFYVPNTEKAWGALAQADSRSDLLQGYLHEGKPTTRVRIDQTNKKAWLCIKGKRDKLTGGKPEFEYQIPHTDGEELLKLCGDRVVSKTRYVIEVSKLDNRELPFTYLLEVDVYYGPFKGLITAEIERPAGVFEKEWRVVRLPSWVGAEVTDEDGWSNRKLALTQKVPALPKSAR